MYSLPVFKAKLVIANPGCGLAGVEVSLLLRSMLLAISKL